MTQTFLPVQILHMMKMWKPHHFVQTSCILPIRSGMFLSSRSWTMPMHPTTPLVKFWSGHTLHLLIIILTTQWVDSCDKNIDALIKSVCKGKKLLPFGWRVDVDHGSPSDVICFDFTSQRRLLSLVQIPSIVTAENLAIDMDKQCCVGARCTPSNHEDSHSGSESNRVGPVIHGSKEECCWHQQQHFYHTVPMMTLLNKAWCGSKHHSLFLTEMVYYTLERAKPRSPWAQPADWWTHASFQVQSTQTTYRHVQNSCAEVTPSRYWQSWSAHISCHKELVLSQCFHFPWKLPED